MGADRVPLLLPTQTHQHCAQVGAGGVPFTLLVVKLQEMGVCRHPGAHHSGSPTGIEWNWAPTGQEAFK